MRYVIFWTLALTALFYATARADDYSARFGPGIENGAPTGVTKLFAVRQETYQVRGIYSAVELGGYVDNAGEGRKGSAIGKLQVGVKPGPATGVYGFGFFGPAGITATDALLGSHLQFATDVGVGVRDMNTFINVGYTHVSNAGIKLPNKGRDYLMFSVGVSL